MPGKTSDTGDDLIAPETHEAGCLIANYFTRESQLLRMTELQRMNQE